MTIEETMEFSRFDQICFLKGKRIELFLTSGVSFVGKVERINNRNQMIVLFVEETGEYHYIAIECLVAWTVFSEKDRLPS